MRPSRCPRLPSEEAMRRSRAEDGRRNEKRQPVMAAKRGKRENLQLKHLQGALSLQKSTSRVGCVRARFLSRRFFFPFRPSSFLACCHAREALVRVCEGRGSGRSMFCGPGPARSSFFFTLFRVLLASALLKCARWDAKVFGDAEWRTLCVGCIFFFPFRTDNVGDRTCEHPFSSSPFSPSSLLAWRCRLRASPTLRTCRRT